MIGNGPGRVESVVCHFESAGGNFFITRSATSLCPLCRGTDNRTANRVAVFIKLWRQVGRTSKNGRHLGSEIVALKEAVNKSFQSSFCVRSRPRRVEGGRGSFTAGQFRFDYDPSLVLSHVMTRNERLGGVYFSVPPEKRRVAIASHSLGCLSSSPLRSGVLEMCKPFISKSTTHTQ